MGNGASGGSGVGSNGDKNGGLWGGFIVEGDGLVVCAVYSVVGNIAAVVF